MNNIKENLSKVGLEYTSKAAAASITTILSIILKVSPISSTLLGQVAGTFVTFLIRMAEDYDNSALRKLEKERIAIELPIIAQCMETKLTEGKTLRQDDFFKKQENDRSSAEEIVEGVLIAAQFEYEQKKLTYYANLVANIAFDSTIDRGESNFLLNTAKNLSYRQLCAITLLSDENNCYNRMMEEEPVTISKRNDIYIEMNELYEMNICTKTYKNNSSAGNDMLGLLYLSDIGKKIYNTMELELIPSEEINELIINRLTE